MNWPMLALGTAWLLWSALAVTISLLRQMNTTVTISGSGLCLLQGVMLLGLIILVVCTLAAFGFAFVSTRG
jgi:hypothetical protein